MHSDLHACKKSMNACKDACKNACKNDDMNACMNVNLNARMNLNGLTNERIDKYRFTPFRKCPATFLTATLDRPNYRAKFDEMLHAVF